MKHVVRKGILAVVIFLVCHLTIIWARDYSDRQKCVCSILTAEEQTYAIDEHLYRVCKKDTLTSGTFMLVRTVCDHGKHLHLTVMPDETIFRGYISTE